jgi:3-hydroxyisobutyrate dehydrogenase-like beta-hydroxyacid dehydrogenase
MTPQRIGILHPGEMGISVAASAKNSGHQVYWVSEGRSSDTKDRANKFELRDAGTLENLYTECSILISVCPPHAAESVARHVVESAYKGVFVDANAISPQRVVRIGQEMAKAGVSFVDGGIIGLPAWKPGATRFYLSGDRAVEVAACFSAGPLGTEVLGPAVGRASALKMCFAAYTKGTAALLCGILGTAESLGVREDLFRQWKRDDAKFVDDATARVRFVSSKAWRWAAEMEEISSTFAAAGMPGDFHAAAAEIYRRLARFKDSPETPPLEEILAALLQGGRGKG